MGMCTKKHCFKSFTTNTTSFTCDACQMKLLIGTKMQRCEQCNWLICLPCGSVEKKSENISKSDNNVVDEDDQEDETVILEAVDMQTIVKKQVEQEKTEREEQKKKD